MGKTETIKKRRVDVYLRSEDQKLRWTHYAKKHRTSLSKLVMDAVESVIGGGLMENMDAKERMSKQIEDLQNERGTLETQNHRLEKYIGMLEKEMNRIKYSSFKNQEMGFRSYNDKVIEILKRSSTPISHNDILNRLSIDPSDTESVQSVSSQLDFLSDYGIIKYSPKGWRWNG